MSSTKIAPEQSEHPQVSANLASLPQGWPTDRILAGLPAGAAAWTIAHTLEGATLVVCPTEAVANQMVVDIGTHLAGAAPVVVFTADDVSAFVGL